MNKMFAVRLLTTAILCSALTAAAHAGAPKTHDGFFMRLSPGIGTASTKIDVTGFQVDVSGMASDFNFAIGGMVKPNLAIHATFFGWSAGDPDGDVAIAGVGSGSGTLNGTVTMGAYGAGLTYYFMPVNMYLSGSAGFGTLQLDADNGVDGETDTGFAMDLTLGKEWWVGDSWGLGLAGGFTYHSLPEKDMDENWSGTSFTVRFSATLN